MDAKPARSVDPAINRGIEIAQYLDSLERSPYWNAIKSPNADALMYGKIPMSSAVEALRPLLTRQGTFEQIGIVDLESQRDIILNFFVATYTIRTQEHTKSRLVYPHKT